MIAIALPVVSVVATDARRRAAMSGGEARHAQTAHNILHATATRIGTTGFREQSADGKWLVRVQLHRHEQPDLPFSLVEISVIDASQQRLPQTNLTTLRVVRRAK